MADEPEGFASRWSRRKRVSQVEDTAPAPDAAEQAAEDAAHEAAEAARLEEEEANRLAAEAVDLDAAHYGDDFSVFLKRGVPQLLRRRALRQFFGSDPLLANLDGLNDYDEDYNNPAHRVYKSAWDAVKGYAEKAQELTEGVAPRDPVEGPGAEAAPEPVPEPEDEVVAASDPASDPAPDPAPEAVDEAPEPRADAVPETEPDAPEAPRRVSLRRRLEV